MRLTAAEANQHFRLLVEAVKDYAICMLDTGGRVLTWNVGAEHLTGYSDEEAVGRHFSLFFTREDREQGRPERELWVAAEQGRNEAEGWRVRKDGARFWANEILTTIRDESGVLRGFSNIIRDITERRRAEEALQEAHDQLERRVQERTAALEEANEALLVEVTERKEAEEARKELLGQLVTAQEEERRRISRELHDQTGQHLTALTLGLKALEDASVGRSASLLLLRRLQQISEELAREMHQLSTQLRPTALDDLGLHITLMNYVEEWSERHQVEADFHSAGLEGERLAPPIETTIYRIVQEALTNVLRHAQAERVSIILERRADRVLAIVEDDGNGFDTESMTQSAGIARRLGLLGMKERAALVGGEVSIESSSGEGTSVFLHIPLPL